jgi:uncharacterized protein (TIGR00251 family)
MSKPSDKDLAAVLHTSKCGIVVDLEVSPGSKRVGLSSINPWRKTLCVGVKAPPKKGEANKEVLELIAQLFDVPSNQVNILSGATSSTKRVEVSCITIEQGKKAILTALGAEDR